MVDANVIDMWDDAFPDVGQASSEAHKVPHPVPASSTLGSRKRQFSSIEEDERPGLTFEFPGFQLVTGVATADAVAAVKQEMLQDLDDLEGDMEAPPETPRPKQAPLLCTSGQQGGASLPDLPDDVLLALLAGCSNADVLNVGQCCKTLYRFTHQNEVWAGRADCKGVLSAQIQLAGILAARLLRYRGCLRTTPQIPPETPGRELYYVKRICLAERLRAAIHMGRFNEIYCMFRAEACQLWVWEPAVNKQDLCTAISQMTHFCWHRCYDTLGLAFCQVAEAAALELLADVGRQQSINSAMKPSLWPEVLRCWQKYQHWLRLILQECSLLASKVNLARSAEWNLRGTNATPSLGDCGKLAFRNEVLLRHDLRGRLQEEARGTVTNNKLGLEEQGKAIKRLLQTLHVADDGTIGKRLQTRDWYREAYGLELDCRSL